MSISRRVLARHVAKQLQSGTPKTEVSTSLAAYIVEHKQEASMDLVVADVLRELSAVGHVSAHVTSARPLSANLKREIADFVKKAEHAKSVELTASVDETLLGGVIIETPSKRLDASVITRLKRLKQA